MRTSASPVPLDAEQEHQISLPGIDIAFHHATHTAFAIDQTGTTDLTALAALDEWFKARGWFLHLVAVRNREDLPASSGDKASEQ